MSRSTFGCEQIVSASILSFDCQQIFITTWYLEILPLEATIAVIEMITKMEGHILYPQYMSVKSLRWLEEAESRKLIANVNICISALKTQRVSMTKGGLHNCWCYIVNLESYKKRTKKNRWELALALCVLMIIRQSKLEDPHLPSY